MASVRDEIGVCVLGLGRVGRAVVDLVEAEAASLSRAAGRRVKVAAVADSSGLVVLDEKATALLAGSAAKLAIRAKDAYGSLAASAALSWSGEFHAGNAYDLAGNLAGGLDYGELVVMDCTPPDYARPEAAIDGLERLLLEGVDVVAANKSPLSEGFGRLAEAARSGCATFGFTAATGLTAPAAAQLPAAFAGMGAFRLEGVLNGTSAYILSAMADGRTDFETALAQARDAGIAEPDATLDVDGWDTAAKLAILASAVFGLECRLSQVERTGIRGVDPEELATAASSGKAVRLVGRAECAKGETAAADVSMTVRPEVLEPGHLLHGLHGTEKGLVVSSSLGSVCFRGGRSSVAVTAAVMVRDMLAGLSQRR